MKLTKKQIINYSDFLSSAIQQLEKDEWWTKELKTEYDIENNLTGFSPIMALKRIKEHLLTK